MGYFAGSYMNRPKQSSAGSSDTSTIVKEIFANVLFTDTLSGHISAINGNTLTVKTPGIYGLNFPVEYQTKQVLVDDAMKINLKQAKTPDEFAKELQQARSSKTFTPPLPYSESNMAVSDLKVGDNINFTFTPDQNLGILNNQFTAVSISVTRQ